RRHTRLQGDWSSDVCSSDLKHIFEARLAQQAHSCGASLTTVAVHDGQLMAIQLVQSVRQFSERNQFRALDLGHLVFYRLANIDRSEERRVGKECEMCWARDA